MIESVQSVYESGMCRLNKVQILRAFCSVPVAQLPDIIACARSAYLQDMRARDKTGILCAFSHAPVADLPMVIALAHSTFTEDMSDSDKALSLQAICGAKADQIYRLIQNFEENGIDEGISAIDLSNYILRFYLHHPSHTFVKHLRREVRKVEIGESDDNGAAASAASAAAADGGK